MLPNFRLLGLIWLQKKAGHQQGIIIIIIIRINKFFERISL